MTTPLKNATIINSSLWINGEKILTAFAQANRSRFKVKEIDFHSL